MPRYFISQYPTFGSYANPTKWKIEQSPYYFWWLALTKNHQYLKFCSDVSVGKKSKTEKLKKVYEDFGDVRYEGDRYVAFAKWWATKLNNGETRGTYLFAEPLTDMRVELIEDVEMAKHHLSSEGELVIRVSKGMKRSHIDKALNRIFQKHIEFEKGRQIRNPNRSNARYSLSKPITIDSLQMAFALYDLIEQAESKGEKENNYDLAKQVGLEVRQRTLGVEGEWEDGYERRVVSVAVSRKKKVAVDAISNVVEGTFP